MVVYNNDRVMYIGIGMILSVRSAELGSCTTLPFIALIVRDLVVQLEVWGLAGGDRYAVSGSKDCRIAPGQLCAGLQTARARIKGPASLVTRCMNEPECNRVVTISEASGRSAHHRCEPL